MFLKNKTKLLTYFRSLVNTLLVELPTLFICFNHLSFENLHQSVSVVSIFQVYKVRLLTSTVAWIIKAKTDVIFFCYRLFLMTFNFYETLFSEIMSNFWLLGAMSKNLSNFVFLPRKLGNWNSHTHDSLYLLCNKGCFN